MQTKILKGLPTLEAEQSVTIWKMNYGFRTDMSSNALKVSVDGLGKKKVDVDTKVIRINQLVFGILESEALKIAAPKDVDMGLDDEEILARMKVVRNLDPDLGTTIYKHIIALNKIDSEKEDDEKKE